MGEKTPDKKGTLADYNGSLANQSNLQKRRRRWKHKSVVGLFSLACKEPCAWHMEGFLICFNPVCKWEVALVL